jgi:hypothetical protein
MANCYCAPKSGPRLSLWIVSIERRTVEVFTNPVGQGDLATYAGTPLTYHEGEAVPLELDGSVIGHLDVKEIFS